PAPSACIRLSWIPRRRVSRGGGRQPRGPVAPHLPGAEGRASGGSGPRPGRFLRNERRLAGAVIDALPSSGSQRLKGEPYAERGSHFLERLEFDVLAALQ